MGKEQEETVFRGQLNLQVRNFLEDVTRFESDATPEEILERVSLGQKKSPQETIQEFIEQSH